MPAVPASPCQGLGTQGLVRSPSPSVSVSCHRQSPLCFLLLGFEGKSEHLAPVECLVPWGRPVGVHVLRCPRYQRARQEALIEHLLCAKGCSKPLNTCPCILFSQQLPQSVLTRGN